MAVTEQAEVWCQKCTEPAIAGGLCPRHLPLCGRTDAHAAHNVRDYKCEGRAMPPRTDARGRQLPPWEQPEARAAMGYAPRRVPDAITDPWLRAQFAQATGASLECDDCGRTDGTHNPDTEH